MTPLLERLKEDRARHVHDKGENWCAYCQPQETHWPCPTARALDVAIAGAELHVPFGIYDECGHDHDADGVGSGVVDVPEVGLVCAEGLQYNVCHECHLDEGDVYEDTEAGCWPCPTYATMELAWEGEPK